MIWDFVAMISAGVGLAGVIMLFRKLSRGRMPSWTIPAAIGAGMIAFSIWNEYSWYGRTTGVLPAQVTVISAPETQNLWRPWTYVFPMHQRFAAFDGTSVITSAVNPAIRQGEVMLVQRWQPTQRIGVAVDCAKGLRADLVEGVSVAPDGTLTGGKWYEAASDDPLQEAACKEG